MLKYCKYYKGEDEEPEWSFPLYYYWKSEEFFVRRDPSIQEARKFWKAIGIDEEDKRGRQDIPWEIQWYLLITYEHIHNRSLAFEKLMDVDFLKEGYFDFISKY